MVKYARKFALLFGAASALAFASTASAETRVSFTTGADYSSGDYGGTEDTEVIAVPFAVRLTTGDWAFRASTSFLHVTGPADIADTTEGGGDSGGGAVTRTGTERGIGDTTLAVERTFRRLGGSNAYLEAGARVRLPTGDEDKGLGVGATDYTVTGELGTSTSNGGAYVSLGYRFLGDRDGIDRQDGAQAGVGGWLPAGDRTRLGAFANWREASIEGNDDPATAGAYVSYRMSETLRVSLSAAAGLSDASADYSTGLRFTWRPEGMNR